MKKLSDAEFEIMKVLWRHSAPMTSNQILGEIEGHNWKLASLMTVLARMADKGAVFCDRSTRTNLYSALVSEEQYKIKESESLLEKLYDKSPKNLIACLYQGKKLSDESVQELRAYLDSLEGGGK
ncbi:MAG: BlaI/MecI/CopY family transcriptional regulator [Lachnospiraceae bacterium]|nr:BlaI/MecI/CopY family transcriptional regulator [Lachnospiraceae bacterium]